MRNKQVEKNHYAFSNYLSKDRWSSVWHQLDEVLTLKPSSVLEIGPGPGIFKLVASSFGIRVETLDIDPDLKPDHVAKADDMPFSSDSFDVVCAFQMLEHVDYDASLNIFSEMVRVAKKNVVISLPDCKKVWSYKIYMPKFGDFKFLIPRPQKVAEHIFDGQHYWEVNKKNYSVSQVTNDLVERNNVKLINTYRVWDFPYHRFFIFEIK